MKISKDQFIKEFQEKAEEWKGCTDERGTYSSLYYLVLSSLDEFEANKITSPYIETAFYKAVSEDVDRLRQIFLVGGYYGLMPMPGTTSPDWGRKHWGRDE